MNIHLSLSAILICGGMVFSQTPVVKIACIGNSITAGSGVPSGGYPGRLGKLLGPKFSVQNEGVSGCTLLKKGDKPYWTKGKLSDALAFKPNIVTIKLGTNDSKPQNWIFKSEFETDLRALIDTLEKAITPKPVIWLCLPVPAWKNTFGIDGQIVLNEEIPIIKKVAANLNLQIIDLHTALLGMEEQFKKDGVHPDSIGQDSIAANVYRALTKTPTKTLGKRLQNFSWLHADKEQVQVFNLVGRSMSGWSSVDQPKNPHLQPTAGTFLLKGESGQKDIVKRIVSFEQQ